MIGRSCIKFKFKFKFNLFFTLFRKIIIHWKRYSYIMIFGMKILKKVLNYDIETVYDDQSSISFRVGHRLFLIYYR